MSDEEQEVVREHTTITSPYLCPELRLHLVTSDCPMWQATESDLERLGVSDPFWAFCWGGGLALTRLILDRPELVENKRVLDFGSGSGLSAIAAAKSAESVLAADIDPLSTAAIQMNADLNGVCVETTTEDLIDTDSKWDTILVGDMCYERALAERIFSWLRTLRDQGAEVLIGDPHRGYLERVSDLVEEVAAYQVPTDVDGDGTSLCTATVFRLL